VSRGKSSLDSLSAAEKGELLDTLLAARPELRKLAEGHAAQRLSVVDRLAVAGDVEAALHGLDIEELNGRAGYRRGVGYVHPVEAADEALEPFLDDLRRRAELGMTRAAVEVAAGILCGLYRCRDGGPESLLEYSPDYPLERASNVLDECGRLGVELPVADLLDLMPSWGTILHRPAHM